MCLSYAVFVVVATLLSSCDAASVDSIKLPTGEVHQTLNAVLTNDNKFLRNSGTNTDEEQRTINWSKLLDFKKWLGITKKIPVKDPVNDFAKHNIATMIDNKKFRKSMYTQWNLYTMDDIMARIGADTLKQDNVKKLIKEYSGYRASLNISP